ncbi:hypothetical protein [Nocardia flavorosea]|uniref:Uncharacterized protein n=1 Tax=Nocardia flavorosea TaxID=53429 RepID=A0A846YVG1_9NOCA|nr:hypothetical protein [Nocardia flavorosea]NKY60989.1 hypothetical protein [Nocardia flavorosea]
MTSTEQTRTATTPDREDYDTEIFGTGEECGVCHFPTGRGEICGNVVYANGPKGRLPLYCGQEGQAHWQKENGTEGNSRHQSSLAGYPRKTLGMTKEDCAALAEAEAARRGIVRRAKSDTAPASAPAAEVAPAPTAPTGPVVPVDLSDALPDSPVEALAELAQLIVGRVVAARKEMETVRNAAEDRAAEIERENADRVEELAAQRAELEAEQEAAREITARAETAIREANEARLRTEGELDGARRRIAELESALEAAEQRRIAEVAEVRRVEREEFRMAMREFATTVRGETSAREAERTEDKPVTEEAVETMAKRVARNEITRRGPVWHIANAVAPRPAAAVLNRMQADGYLHLGSQGDPERVTLTDTYPGPRR